MLNALRLATLLTLCGATPEAPRIEPEAFQGWFDAALEGRLRLPAANLARAARFRYVFVGGFANERMPGYFDQSAQELRRNGVPPGAIHFVFPSSHKSFDANCDAMRASFLEIASRGPEPLVVIAHSRGASDALAFSLRHVDFARDRIYALFLIQGAFGGTGAADYVMGEGTPMDGQMPLRLRVLAHALGRVERYVLERGKHDGLPELTRDRSAEFWERMRADHADALKVVGPKTFYITSQTRPNQLRLFQRAVATYLGTYYGPNDGVVMLDDQSLSGLGTTLAVLDAGHTALTHRFPATRARRGLRRALVESILMAVGQGQGSDGVVQTAGRVGGPGRAAQGDAPRPERRRILGPRRRPRARGAAE
jgi:hypothetical protein